MEPGELSLPDAWGSAVQPRRPWDRETPRTESRAPTSARPGRGCAWCEHRGLAELRVWDRRFHRPNLGLPLRPDPAPPLLQEPPSHLEDGQMGPIVDSSDPPARGRITHATPTGAPRRPQPQSPTSNTRDPLSITCSAVRGRDAGPRCSPLLPLTSLLLPRSRHWDRAPSPCGRGCLKHQKHV